jgi:hypothetical protein
MKPIAIGRRREPFAAYTLLLFEDHLEEVARTPLALEVRRLFFDEVQGATVHRGWATTEALLCLLAAGASLLPVALMWNDDLRREALQVCGPVAALLVVVAAAFLVRRPRILVVHAPGLALRTRLPLGASRRAARLRALREAVLRFQTARTGDVEGPVPVVPPAAAG